MHAAASMEQASPGEAGLGRYCGARTRAGRSCRRPRGWGTDHKGYGRCKNHGGSSPSGRQAAAREEADAQLKDWGLAVQVDPTDALLECVYRSAGLATYLRRRVNELRAEQVADGGELNVWLRLEREETDRLARFSKMALDAGVAERRVRLAERHADLIAQALEEALAGVDLPAPQRAQLVRGFATRLAVLETTEAT